MTIQINNSLEQYSNYSSRNLQWHLNSTLLKRMPCKSVKIMLMNKFACLEVKLNDGFKRTGKIALIRIHESETAAFCRNVDRENLRYDFKIIIQYGSFIFSFSLTDVALKIGRKNTMLTQRLRLFLNTPAVWPTLAVAAYQIMYAFSLITPLRQFFLTSTLCDNLKCICSYCKFVNVKYFYTVFLKL